MGINTRERDYSTRRHARRTLPGDNVRILKGSYARAILYSLFVCLRKMNAHLVDFNGKGEKNREHRKDVRLKDVLMERRELTGSYRQRIEALSSSSLLGRNSEIVGRRQTPCALVRSAKR